MLGHENTVGLGWHLLKSSGEKGEYLTGWNLRGGVGGVWCWTMRTLLEKVLC